MDRPDVPFMRLRIGGVLVLAIMAAAGCRSTKSEVPPGRAYSRTGGAPPTVGFSNEPHPAVGPSNMNSFNAAPGASGDDRLVRASKPAIFGTPTAGERIAQPTSNKYGPPGTSGLDPTQDATPADLAEGLMRSNETGSQSLTKDLRANPPSDAPQ
ncbi:hypothetical protein [Paludisphaera rhizosphaerae]|uniref:hypothetical protein n=1 Tax=Paludisphaera rhizosphaerae TaxID=2711216 RepID=UPI0013EC4B62|nr:hypothetical protein [Paludisphaera rhizosphaerae]